MMKKIFNSIIAMLAVVVASAQVSSEPAENINPADSVKIIVDLDQLDITQDYVQNLIADADAGLDLFIWTWKPAEHPAGHPLVNGLGGAAWKNSNPALMMTKEANHVYSYTMVPTEFYEVDAGTVYQEDIHFLVKPKDGGGYGDPDRKSGDLVLKIDPPATDRPPVFNFPSNLGQDDVLTVVYENWRETKASMQNLHPDSAYIDAQCKLVSGSTIKIPENYFMDITQYPQAKMVEVEEGVFEWVIIPERYFNLQPGQEIEEIIIIVRKPTFAGGNERIENALDVTIKCP
jgi:hypothetical protein